METRVGQVINSNVRDLLCVKSFIHMIEAHRTRRLGNVKRMNDLKLPKCIYVNYKQRETHTEREAKEKMDE